MLRVAGSVPFRRKSGGVAADLILVDIRRGLPSVAHRTPITGSGEAHYPQALWTTAIWLWRHAVVLCTYWVQRWGQVVVLTLKVALTR